MPQPPNILHTFAHAEATRAARPKSPQLPHALAVAFVALTVLIMAYSSLFAVLPILVYFLLWLSLPLVKGLRLLHPTRAMLMTLAVPILCLLSTAWSTHAAQTLYLGTAFVVFSLCIAVMNRAVSFRALVEGLVLGLTVTLLITLLSGQYAGDMLDPNPALVGYFGSKNTVGFLAELGIVSACTLWFLSRGLMRKLVSTVLPLAIACLCLTLSHSGTALVSCVVALVATAALALLSRFPHRLRLLLLLLAGVLGVALIGIASSIDLEATLLNALGKDATLTGRTYLWLEGSRIGMESPLIGHGYSAFWVEGEPRAERYWQEFNIASKTGFHFHNIYVQALVDLGMIGALVIALLVIRNVVLSARACLHALSAETAFLFALSLMFLLRSMAEIDFFVGPFGMGALLFYSLPLRLGEKAQRA